MTILAWLLLITPALAGISCFAALKLTRERMTLVLTGATAGVTIFTTAAYIITSLAASNTAILWTLAGAAAAIAVLAAPTGWPHLKKLPTDRIAIILFGILLILSWIIAPKLLIERPDGLYTGIINAYGDVAWHLANITMFVDGQTIPPENPIFSDSRLTYPFMTNVFSALLVAAGADVTDSLNLPALLMIPLLLTLLYSLVREMTDNKKVALLTVAFFLFGGATLGWLRFPAELQASGRSLIDFLLHLPNRDFSGVGTDENGFHFLNPVTTLLLPQRSLLFGFPLAFTILLLLLPHHRQHHVPSLIAAGVLAGILPLFHGHTVLALLPVIILFFIMDVVYNPRESTRTVQHWLLFVLPALIIGLPEILYYLRGSSEAGSFFRWGPGWMSGDTNIIWYWLKNTGLFIPVAIAGLFMRRAPHLIKLVAGAGLLLFLVANLWLFAPWAWDNFKLFVYFFLFILPLVSWVTVDTIQRIKQPLVTALVILLVAAHLLSAGLDLWKLALPTTAEWQEWSTADIAAAAQIRAHTKPSESIVTAPTHNSAVVLAGRPRYLGYAAHVWSHGGDPWDRETALKLFYEGQLPQLPEATPNYILVGPQERGQYPNLTIRPDWQLVTQTDTHTLYRLPASTVR